MQKQPATTSLVGPRQAVHGRPRNKGGQRRRRSQDERVEPVDDRASGSIPRPPRPKRAARGNETGASGSSRNTGGRPLARAVADPVAQTGAGKGAGRRAADVYHSGSGKVIEPSREVGCELSPAVPSSLGEGELEAAFPALPLASGHRIVAVDTPSPAPAMARPGSLDYSALAERLATETAAAAVAKAAPSPSGAAGGSTAGGTISRLSVLPSFGNVRRGDAKLRGASSDHPPGSSELQVGDVSPSRLMSAEDNTGGRPSAPMLPLRSADEKNRLRAGAETAALRARLRERWFRLEATRKAQRQRESAERVLMAAEDGSALTHEQDGGAESSGSRTQPRSRLADPPGVAGDGGISGDGRDSGDEGNTSSSSSSSSDEVSDQERPKHPRSSPCLTTMPGAKSAAEVSCPGGIKASYISVESDGTSARTAQGIDVSSPESRAVSAAGIAAIRRFEAAAAASIAFAPSTEPMASTGPDVASSAHQDLSTQDTSDRTDVSDVAADPGDPAGASLAHLEHKEIHAAPCERDKNSGGVPALHGERIHAACEAGMAGLLNDLLVRSGGRVTDGKDKVRGEGRKKDRRVLFLVCII